MTSAVTGAVAGAVSGVVASAVSGAVASASGAVRTSAAAAVRTIFDPERIDPDDTDTNNDIPNTFTFKASGSGPSTSEEMAPTQQQFTDLQQQYEALKQQLDEVLARQSGDQRARTIDEDSERRRKEAYETAGLPYTPLAAPSHSPAIAAPPAPRQTEYRVSHKSVGYLRPADASNKPFEAMDGEVYVRLLAWLAHLRTKLDLKEDFHYKNQVLQVASECLVGRAAAWWTAIGQRMRNILLTDYTLEIWHLQIQVLCQSREQTRKDALARHWRVGREECWDYV